MCTVKLVLDTNSSALASGYEFHQKIYIVVPIVACVPYVAGKKSSNNLKNVKL